MLRWVEGRTFVMGSPVDERGRKDDETPHEVTVDGLYVTRSEITQAQWRAVMGDNPSHFTECGAECPVEQVSWLDAVAFANRLSEREGRTPAYALGDEVTWDRAADGYRLLTEAEWERVARADLTHRYAGSRRRAAAVGWVDGRGPRPVCTKPKNAYGLCDLTRNVWEWVWDWHGPYAASPSDNPAGPPSGTRRGLRGGSCYTAPVEARVTTRGLGAPDSRFHDTGLRLARGR